MIPAGETSCPAGCGREKRPADLLCRRCWYILPATLKQDYLAAREALQVSKTRSAIEALKVAKQNILNSVVPRGN